MKIRGFIVFILLGVLLVGSVSCGGPGLPKPTVGYVPQGWSVLSDYTYTTCLGYEEGVLIYGDGELQSPNSVEIHYVDMYDESSAAGGTPVTDVDAIVDLAIYNLEFDSIEPEESGKMIVSGQLAGYSNVYDQGSGWYWMQIVCIKGATYVSIYANYKATPEDEADVMSLINSISF